MPGLPKTVRFEPGSECAFIPERCSESARNPVRFHRGTMFSLAGFLTFRLGGFREPVHEARSNVFLAGTPPLKKIMKTTSPIVSRGIEISGSIDIAVDSVWESGETRTASRRSAHTQRTAASTQLPHFLLAEGSLGQKPNCETRSGQGEEHQQLPFYRDYWLFARHPLA